MKKEAKCDCVHICKDCKHYSKDRDDIDSCIPRDMNMCAFLDEYCLARTKHTKSCVDGTEKITHVLCRNYNKDGQCKKFTPLPHVELKRIVEKYRHKKVYTDDPFGRETVATALASDLVKVLESGKSAYVETEFYGNDPYKSTVIVSKKAILDSIRIRGLRLEEHRKGDLYGECGKLNEATYLRKKSWLDRAKEAINGKKDVD